MAFFFLFVAACAGYGMVRMIRQSRASIRYLEAAKDEAPPVVEHLPPNLRRLVQDTRLLRVSLEAPLRDVRDFLDGELGRNADDVETFDNMLMDVTRSLVDWVGTIDRLSESDRGRMLDVGADPEPIRVALQREGWSFERRNMERPGQPAMDARLGGILGELLRIESALQLPPRPYR